MKNINKLTLIFVALTLGLTGVVNASSDYVNVKTKDTEDISETKATLKGKVTEGNDVKVWFVIDKDDHTPSCSDSDLKESVSGRYDDGDYFEERVTGLDEDEKYYYRACAEDENDDIVSGDVEHFRTDSDNNNDENVEVVTKDAKNISETKATLKGKVTEGNDVKVWFVIDNDDHTPSCSDSDLKEKVSGRYDDGEYFEEKVTGLDENEKYYYRACAEDENDDIVSGDVEHFRTDDDYDDDDDYYGGYTREELERKLEILMSMLRQLLAQQGGYYYEPIYNGGYYGNGITVIDSY